MTRTIPRRAFTLVLLLAVSFQAFSVAAREVQPYLVRQRVQDLYPGGQILTVDLKDGLYFIFLTYGGERVLLEMTRAGQVIDTVNLGPTALEGELLVYLPPNVAGAAQSLNPQAIIISATEDADGVFHLRLRDQFGVARNVAVTRSGRVLGQGRAGQNGAQNFPLFGTPAAQHSKSVRRLPGAVLAAVKRAHPAGVVVEVDHIQQGARYGRPAYLVTVADAGRVFEMGLSETGKVLQNRLGGRTEGLEQLPNAVRAAVLSLYPEGVLYGADARGDRYAVDVLANGLPYHVVIGRRGEVISTRRDSGY